VSFCCAAATGFCETPAPVVPGCWLFWHRFVNIQGQIPISAFRNWLAENSNLTPIFLVVLLDSRLRGNDAGRVRE
jgi:hypothetical protein